MKLVSALTLLLFSTITLAQAQETTIRILGVYPAGTSYDPVKMKSQLQNIASAWNTSGLPASSATTVTLLNLAVAVPVNYTLPPNADAAAQSAWADPQIIAMRNAWQADVLILFMNSSCGRTGVTYWIDGNGNFVATSQDLDLRRRAEDYVSVVNPECFLQTASHEFGHLAGGGHMTNQFGGWHC